MMSGNDNDDGNRDVDGDGDGEGAYIHIYMSHVARRDWKDFPNQMKSI